MQHNFGVTTRKLQDEAAVQMNICYRVVRLEVTVDGNRHVSDDFLGVGNDHAPGHYDGLVAPRLAVALVEEGAGLGEAVS